eukprot:gnl/TRDRNA2_/TRDRNA2_134285_c0_seq1.p1 gnl/TRDRNA2_/TRDRNA2_134285_c0~~gnl/TRDRNA2_/TRDRNA2_134285_c0_seq1.p1  ORF type:complete len:459 (+),score=70.15 gnl/TRDRNA2_/TRDRNA2_134285_c0_seq1:52-1377(+)
MAPAMLTMTPTPLDQGQEDSCVAHAFSQVCAHVLRLKYSVPILPETVLAAAMAGCAGWGGMDVRLVCEAWNARLPAVADANCECNYRFRVRCSHELSFDDAFSEVQTFSGTPTVVATVQGAALRHAVAAFEVLIDTRQLVAVNSWGGHEMLAYIDSRQLESAFFLDPEVVGVAQHSRPPPAPPPRELPIPEIARLYHSKVCSRGEWAQLVSISVVRPGGRGGQALTVDVSPATDSVRTLKAKIQQRLGVDEDEQVLTLAGEPLQDRMRLLDCGVRAGSELLLAVGVGGEVSKFVLDSLADGKSRQETVDELMEIAKQMRGGSGKAKLTRSSAEAVVTLQLVIWNGADGKASLELNGSEPIGDVKTLVHSRLVAKGCASADFYGLFPLDEEHGPPRRSLWRWRWDDRLDLEEGRSAAEACGVCTRRAKPLELALVHVKSCSK